MKATVLGSTGFIGRALRDALERSGHDVIAPERAELHRLDGDLGSVFYCIGMTGHFRQMPRETVTSQVALLADVLFRCDFQSFIYLSSTRVYGTTAQDGAMDEARSISVVPGADKTYDLSKLLGESLCAARSGARMISARLSNVYGPGMSANTFLGSVLGALAHDGRVRIEEDPASSKDYVALTDVVSALLALTASGAEGCYNIASGTPVTHADIAHHLAQHGHDVGFVPAGPVRRFPTISVDKLRNVIDYRPRSLLDDLPGLLASMKHDRKTGEPPNG